MFQATKKTGGIVKLSSTLECPLHGSSRIFCMKHSWTHAAAILSAILVSSAQISATCGGGGGGGMGGMGGGSTGPSGPGMGSNEQVYNVPWRVRVPELPPVTAGLVLYWFPSSVEEVQKSSLRTSRILSLYATQCVSMEIVDAATPLGQKLVPEAKLPIAVLVTPDGSPLGKAENKDGFLRANQVEKLVDAEYKRRENQVDAEMKDAKHHAKSGDTTGAIPLYKAVLEQ